MTNSELLKQKIAGSGLKLSFIAEKIGISLNGLKNKVEGRNEFKQNEIIKFCELLNIRDLDEKEAIFFAEKVD